MSSVRVGQVDLLYSTGPEPQIRVAKMELVSGSLPPTRFLLTNTGWIPLTTEQF